MIGVNSTEPVALIRRTRVTPASLAGRPIKVFGIILSGILGAIGSVASIWSVWIPEGYTSIFILTAGFSVILVFLGVDLKRKFFIRIPHFVNLELDGEGYIFFTEIGGVCPKCGGELKLRNVGKNKTTILRCTRNPDHCWRFDPTVLENI